MGHNWETKTMRGIYMAKENKDCFVKVRITKSERDQIETYCEKYDLSISEFMRLAIEKQLWKGE